MVINLTIFTDLRKAGKSDRFEDAGDCRAIRERIVAMVEGSHYCLVEALAEAVAQICLEHPATAGAKVREEKPSALRFTRSVGVEIVRWKTS